MLSFIMVFSTPARSVAWGFSKYLQLYARAGDIIARCDVGRMSCWPTHTDEMRVLVVEDHATLAGRSLQGLRRAGMAVNA
jgi:hypothetical protein